MPFLVVGTVAAWTPGTYPAPSSGLTVDRNQRNDVLAFWHGVYLASEGFESRMNWTGSYSTANGAEGTTSAAFIADTERRLNYFRAMAGVPATARMNTNSPVVILGADPHKPAANTTKASAAQRAALMMTMTFTPSTGQVTDAYSHNPPVTATWSAVPWNAANKGNIGINVHGPNAITSYMAEEVPSAQSGENSAAGHRRWLLRSSATNFATGDIPPYFNVNDLSNRRAAANVTYVFQNPGEVATVAPAFVAYPPPGFFPAPLNTKFWSLTYPGAGFPLSATVTVQQVGGASVPVTIRERNNLAAGDPTITWEVPAAHAAKSFAEDRTYQITVSGMTGAGVPPSHSYQVTFVDPNRLNSDQSLAGTSVPHALTPATYTFTPPPFAEGLRVNTYRQTPVTWTEDAEPSTASTVIDRTSGTYVFVSPNIGGFSAIASSRSFRLTHHTSLSAPDQIFELGRRVMPGPNAALKFAFRRGFMSTSSKLDVETSADGGATWKKLGATISGVSNTETDNFPTNASIPVAASAVPILFRFRYYATPGSIYADDFFPDDPTGIFFDNITLENADWLEPRKTNELAAGSSAFTLDTTTQGGPMLVGEQWHLALQTKLGDRWFPDGPLKAIIPAVTPPPPPLSPYELWLTQHPGLTGDFDDDDDDDGVPNGVEYAFSTDPTKRTVLNTEVIAATDVQEISIRMPLPATRSGIIYDAECSESLAGGWMSAGVTVTIANGMITATAPMPPSGRCFLRWKITLP